MIERKAGRQERKEEREGRREENKGKKKLVRKIYLEMAMYHCGKQNTGSPKLTRQILYIKLGSEEGDTQMLGQLREKITHRSRQ